MLSLCARLYALLLVAYQAGFRRASGPRMAQVFRAYRRDADRRRVARGLLDVWVVALGDLTLSACAERHARMKAPFSHDKGRRKTNVSRKGYTIPTKGA